MSFLRARRSTAATITLALAVLSTLTVPAGASTNDFEQSSVLQALSVAAPSTLVRLRWEDTGDRQYQVALSADSDYAAARSILSDDSAVVVDVPSSGEWFWRVRPVRPFIGPWEPSQSIVVSEATLNQPSAPAQLAPQSGRKIAKADVRLTWHPRPGAKYDVRVSSSPSMTAPYSQVVGTGHVDLRLDRGMWWWQVRQARTTANDYGKWSDPRSIAIDPAMDKRAPSRAGGLRIVRRTDDGAAVVSWPASKDDRPGVRYWVLVNGRRTLMTNDHTNVRVPLDCGHSSRITAVAVDAVGRTSRHSPEAKAGGPQCPDEQAPSAPSAVTVSSVTEESAIVKWHLATDDKAVAGYVVQRNGETAGGSETKQFELSGLHPASPYTVTVYSRDNTGNVSLASGSVAFTSATPVQSEGTVRAFVLASDGGSIADAQEHYLDLDWIYPTYFNMTVDGGLTGHDQPYFDEWFQVRGVKVLPRILASDLALMETAFATPEKREAFAAMVADRAEASGWDGVQLDFEPSVPKIGVDGLTIDQRMYRFAGMLTDVSARLATHLHADGRLLSVSVPVNWCQLGPRDKNTLEPVYCSDPLNASVTTRPRPKLYDYPGLLAATDELWVMAWGLHWSTSEPGPSADHRWVAAASDWLATVVDDDPTWADKVTLARNIYSQDWEYSIARTDVLSVPALLPGGAAVPTCENGSKARPRPLAVEPGDTTVTLQWICPYGVAVQREYQPMKQVLRDEGVTPTYDAASGESYVVLPSGTSGLRRELWFADARSVGDLKNVADSHGWRVGVWRLGREDQAIWPLLGSGGA